MQAFWAIVWFFTKVLGFAILLLWAEVHFLDGPQLGGTTRDFLAAYTISFWSLLFDEAIFYPRFRSPLRHLHIVPIGLSGKMVVEKPRGKTPLKWAKQFPDVSLFNSRGKLGQSVLYPVGPDALKDIFSTNAYDFVKPYGLRAYLAQMAGYGLITIEGSSHKEQRRAVFPSFNIKHIRALYPTMWEKAGILVDRVEDETKVNGKINVGIWASRFALDIIGRAALARDFDALGMEEYHPIAQAMSNLLEPERFMLSYLLFNISLPPWLVRNLHVKASRFMKREHMLLRRWAEDMYDSEKKRLTSATPGKTTESTILTHIIGNSNLNRTEIVDNIITFIGAGHETSAASITWACHLLSLPENMEYQTKLREEVRRSFPTQGGSADWTASAATLQPLLETSPYLHGTCEEVLRLFPAVPATIREPVRQTSIAGTVIPKGILVVIMPWVINRNPRYWGEDAEEFRPDRWFDKTADGGLRVNKHGGAESNFCEATFLHGPRACVGRDFAKAEMKCALAAIFGRFKVERLDGDTGKVRISGQVTIKPMGGLFLKMTPIPGW